jgi:hypothetical protein
MVPRLVYKAPLGSFVGNRAKIINHNGLHAARLRRGGPASLFAQQMATRPLRETQNGHRSLAHESRRALTMHPLSEQPFTATARQKSPRAAGASQRYIRSPQQQKHRKGGLPGPLMALDRTLVAITCSSALGASRRPRTTQAAVERLSC